MIRLSCLNVDARRRSVVEQVVRRADRHRWRWFWCSMMELV
jgi:hypothetical protein